MWGVGVMQDNGIMGRVIRWREWEIEKLHEDGELFSGVEKPYLWLAIN